MANELVIHYPTGATLYALLFDATGQIWNGSSFVAPASASWTDYDIAMVEVATATGVYRASMPAAAAGVYGWVVRKQAGGSPAVTDIAVGVGRIEWNGAAEVALTSRATQASADAILNGLTGVGLIPLTYTVTEPNGTTPISGVTVELYTEQACLNCVRRGVTNSFGVITFWLTAAGTYWIRNSKDGYSFGLDSETVSA